MKLILGTFGVAFVCTRGVFCKVVPFGLQYPIIRELNSYRNRTNIQLSGYPIKWARAVAHTVTHWNVPKQGEGGRSTVPVEQRIFCDLRYVNQEFFKDS